MASVNGMQAEPDEPPVSQSTVSHIDAVTLATMNMAEAVAFYECIGLTVAFGGPDAPFTTMACGTSNLNLQHSPDQFDRSDGARRSWGRFIVHVADVDAAHRSLTNAGYQADAEPTDAPWGERYFHIVDPNGHEVSIARRL